MSAPRSRGAHPGTPDPRPAGRRGPVRHPGRHRTVLGAIAAVLVMAAGLVLGAPPAGAYPTASVTLTGHGYGHGRGMGQWGAFGWAYSGTTWTNIVQYYYSGALATPTTPSEEATLVRVALTENNGNDVIVTSGSGFTVAGQHIAAGQAARMHQTGGSWEVDSGPGCAGPWSPFANGVVDPQAVPDTDATIGNPSAATLALQLCMVGGNLSVRGSLRATYNSAAQARTVNVVPLEEYVTGVVPNESPAYWGTLGAPGPQGYPWGFQSLEAQAVAARSYVMAALGSYGGYADTCDQSCQTYRGIANESPITDAATLDTLGVVMKEGTQIMTTEYSASTGGYSAPGTFPAMPDAGDSICPPGVNGACNPNHTWKVSIPVSSIEATWPQLGSLQAVTVTSRNGYGDWGGRVLSMTLVGSSQNVVLTGDQFAADFNLMSNWFTVTRSLPSPAVGIAGTSDNQGYWLTGSDGTVLAYGDAGAFGSMGGQFLVAPVVGFAPTPDRQGYWEAAADGGVFNFGDAPFAGSAGALALNRPIVGMASTPSGHGYWLVAADGGIFTYGDAGFYGSAGNLVLNQPVVGMAATADGHGYWLVAADGGIFAYGDAVFRGSMGGHPLNQPIVGMSTVPGGGGYRMVAADGGIFSFGDAGFFGSAGNLTLAQPVVAMAGTTDGQGYWMVAADGGIFAYGDAGFFGSGAG